MFGGLRKDKDRQLFELLQKHVSCSHDAANALGNIFHGESLPKVAGIIKELEHQCDAIVRDVRNLLDSTTFMQFDHEDNGMLVAQLDEVIDGIDAVACRMVLYHSVPAQEDAEALVSIIVEMTNILLHLVPSLRKLDRERAYELVREIRAYEKKADRILESGIEKLHSKNSHTQLSSMGVVEVYIAILHVFEWERIIELLEEVTDHVENIADVVERIMRKYSLA